MTVLYVSPGIIIDDIVFPDGQQQLGVLGGGGPQAAWGMALAARSGALVGLLSGVGRDFDWQALAPLQAMDINTDGVRATDLPTPRAWQLLEADGRRRHVWQVGQDISDLQTHPDAATILDIYPETRVVHWGIHPEDPYLSPCRPLRERGILVSIEPFKGLEEPLADDDLRTVLSSCDIYSPNWAEAASLFGTANRRELLARAQALGAHLLTLRHGAEGVEAWDLYTGAGVMVPAAPVAHVADPVGAGDAFCGAFAVTWHDTGDLVEAAISGVTAASYMLEQVGLPARRPSLADQMSRQEAARAGIKSLSLD